MTSFARAVYAPGRTSCQDCEETYEGLTQGAPNCAGCPIAELELWPANQEAWDAYQQVGNVLQAGGLGPALLDTAGVILVLERLDLAPEGPGGWEDLLDKLQIIHWERVQAGKSAKDGEDG